MPHTVPALPYAYNVLEPYIDEQTMHIHHDKHHQAYVDNLNKALEAHPDLQQKSVDELLMGLSKLPVAIQTAVRNNGGGHWNHTFFWNIMAPKAGGEPKGVVADAIKRYFGDFATFKDKFVAAGLGRFGSGWAWLIVDKTGNLNIESTANQDSPISDGKVPILGVDVWEHAYYLKYQNKRKEYLEAFWNVVNWKHVEEHLKKAKK